MHCTNGKITTAQFAKHFKENNPCKHWLPFEQQREYTDEQIRGLLVRITKQLEKALQVLKVNNGLTNDDDKEKARQLSEQAKSTDE